MGQSTRSAQPQALGGVRGQLGLYPEDFGVRAQRLDRRADAGRQSAAADRDEHVLDVGQIGGDLQADRALAGDDVGVVERRNQHAARRLDQLGGDLFALARTAQHDLAPWSRVACTLTFGVFSGITMCAGMPNTAAA